MAKKKAYCGEDFCDRCGDCLECYGDDPCTDGKPHGWEEDEDDADDASPTE
jgi:hypothetical protein